MYLQNPLLMCTVVCLCRIVSELLVYLFLLWWLFFTSVVVVVVTFVVVVVVTFVVVVVVTFVVVVVVTFVVVVVVIFVVAAKNLLLFYILQELISPATLVTLPGEVLLIITQKKASTRVSRLAEVQV